VARFSQHDDGKQKGEDDMWLDELAVFVMMCWALAWVVLSGDGARLTAGRGRTGPRR